MTLIQISQTLAQEVEKLNFTEPIAHIYNPLQYAWPPHEKYLQRYGKGTKKILLVGMNPGPFGMAQTGIPFGDVNSIKNWMEIEAPVDSPKNQHPKRPIWGFDCPRSEVSGSRLWGWAESRFGKPSLFFKDFFVVNFCPLVFMEKSGKNLTPDKIKIAERIPLLEVCNAALIKTVKQLKPKWVIGVGAFAEKQSKEALEKCDVQIGRILHPSPASPQANRGWSSHAEKQLMDMGIKLP